MVRHNNDKIILEDTDFRRFELSYIDYIRPIVIDLTQLDILRLMRMCKSVNNIEYYELFKSLLDKIDEVVHGTTNYKRLDNGLPRRRITKYDIKEKNKYYGDNWL